MQCMSKLTLALDVVYNLNSGLGDVRHILAVRELAEEGGSTNDDIDTVHTCQTPISAALTARHAKQTHRSRQLSAHRPYGTGCG